MRLHNQDHVINTNAFSWQSMDGMKKLQVSRKKNKKSNSKLCLGINTLFLIQTFNKWFTFYPEKKRRNSFAREFFLNKKKLNFLGPLWPWNWQKHCWTVVLFERYVCIELFSRNFCAPVLLRNIMRACDFKCIHMSKMPVYECMHLNAERVFNHFFFFVFSNKNKIVFSNPFVTYSDVILNVNSTMFKSSVYKHISMRHRCITNKLYKQ